MTTPRVPSGLDVKGRKLWRDMLAVEGFTPNPAELVLLEEACRIADRLDRLDGVLNGKGIEGLLRLRRMDDDGDITVTVDSVLSESRQQANVLKQLVAALRVPDPVSGKKPQHRGARGAYQSRGAGSVSSLDRARAAAGQ